MRPIIGILAEVDSTLAGRVGHLYVHAIEQSGGVPLLLPYVAESDTLASFAECCHGFLFTGGGDIDPLRYGEERLPECGEPSCNRDVLDLAAFNAIMQTGKPIMAICRGIQLVNVALGGTLYQDLPSRLGEAVRHRQEEPQDAPSHTVRLLAETPLRELAQQEVIPANSFHHQAIKALGRGLEVMATAEDGVVEAVYLKGEQYLRAYQWHPERLYGSDPRQRALFDDFINACLGQM